MGEVTNITEIIPKGLPEWAVEAMKDGRFFAACVERVLEWS